VLVDEPSLERDDVFRRKHQPRQSVLRELLRI
jgi:hypothetical protein